MSRSQRDQAALQLQSFQQRNQPSFKGIEDESPTLPSIARGQNHEEFSPWSSQSPNGRKFALPPHNQSSRLGVPAKRTPVPDMLKHHRNSVQIDNNAIIAKKSQETPAKGNPFSYLKKIKHRAVLGLQRTGSLTPSEESSNFNGLPQKQVTMGSVANSPNPSLSVLQIKNPKDIEMISGRGYR